METITKARKVRKDKGIKRGPRKKVVTLAKAADQLAVNEPVIVTAAQLPMLVDDSYPRSVLSEGRNYGIAFAFAKLDGNTFKCVGPLSPCKDYLNDQVFTEATGKPFSAYGYHAKHEKLFQDGVAHVVMRVLPYKHGGKYSTQDKDTAHLDAHYKAIASFLGHFEELLKLPTRTLILKVPDSKPTGNDYYVASIPTFWAKYTYLISLWSLLVRVAVEGGWDGSQGNPMEFFKACKTGDCYHVKNAITKLDKMIAGQVPIQNMNDSVFWHNMGIVSFGGFE